MTPPGLAAAILSCLIHLIAVRGDGKIKIEKKLCRSRFNQIPEDSGERGGISLVDKAVSKMVAFDV